MRVVFTSPAYQVARFTYMLLRSFPNYSLPACSFRSHINNRGGFHLLLYTARTRAFTRCKISFCASSRSFLSYSPTSFPEYWYHPILPLSLFFFLLSCSPLHFSPQPDCTILTSLCQLQTRTVSSFYQVRIYLCCQCGLLGYYSPVFWASN